MKIIYWAVRHIKVIASSLGSINMLDLTSLVSLDPSCGWGAVGKCHYASTDRLSAT